MIKRGNTAFSIKNKFAQDDGHKIRIYKNTAILTMRSTGAGVDMGEAWGGDGVENGHTTVMVKRKGKWLVAADIIGRDVEN